MMRRLYQMFGRLRAAAGLDFVSRETPRLTRNDRLQLQVRACVLGRNVKRFLAEFIPPLAGLGMTDWNAFSASG